MFTTNDVKNIIGGRVTQRVDIYKRANCVAYTDLIFFYATYPPGTLSTSELYQVGDSLSLH